MRFILLLALGDNLISLSLLSEIQLKNKKIKILGTKNTKNIINLLNLQNKFDLELIFNDIPSFYDIKKQGYIKAISDFIKFIFYLKKNNIKNIVLEKKDFRSKILSLLFNVYIPKDNKNIYIQRKNLIEDIYNQTINLNQYKLSRNTPQKVLINPLTRVELKNIKDYHLKYVLEKLHINKCKITLIDIEKKYSKFRYSVNKYLTNTSLEDVKQLMMENDLYIGGDSFLIHFAYYLKRNYFIFFYRDNDDFLPPNIEKDFYIKIYKSEDFKKEIDEKFRKIGLFK